jgi:hypothetical protein
MASRDRSRLAPGLFLLLSFCSPRAPVKTGEVS